MAAWKEMRLDVAAYLAQVRHPGLTLEQQGRLALAWPAIYLGDAHGEVEWRRALGYTENAWSEVRERYEMALPGWQLPMLTVEYGRQERLSDQQRENVSHRKRTKGNGRKRPLTVVNGGEPNLTDVYLASASASESEPLPESEKPVRQSKSEPPGFSRFWDAYKNSFGRRTEKPAALAEWKRQRCEDIADQVLAALERYKKTREWADGFMPYPAKWLKHRLWDEEYATESEPDPLWDGPRVRS
jgi:hypothetical protein